MGMTLTNDYVDDFSVCVGKELLSYVSYRGRARCFAYPQFMVEKDELTLLGKNAFPDVGCLPMTIGHSSPEALKAEFGNVVVMTVNDEDPQRNRNYPEQEQSRYNSIIDPTFPRSHAAIEFVSLSKHPLSARLVQVVEIQEQLDLSDIKTRTVHATTSELPDCTRLTLVAQESHGAKNYVGPFEITCSGVNEINLNPSKAFDSFVGAFSADDFVFSADLTDEYSQVVASFVDHEELVALFDASDDLVDWMSDEDLKNALVRISRMGESPLSKAQARSLRAQVEECLDIDAGIKMTPERRARMADQLRISEEWLSLPQDLGSQVMEGMDLDELASLIFENQGFKDVYEKLLGSTLVQNRLEQEKERFRTQTEKARSEAQTAQAKLDAAKEELATFNKQLEEKRQQLEEDMADQLAEVEHRKNALERQADDLADQVAALKQGKVAVEEEIRGLVDGMTKESALAKLLEWDVLHQVVSFVRDDSVEPSATEDVTTIPTASMPPVSFQLSKDDGFDSERTLRTIAGYINEGAGRDMDLNEVANLLLCVTQGYVTTLSGLPGTGKTSLVNILAQALGLRGQQGNPARFVEVPVERGWTSYKDFIGYYNPFDKALEKTNPQVFDAFAAMDTECRLGVTNGEVPPFLFLLDEANLSSLEHYWSPFLRACDSFGASSLDLSLGGDGHFSVPSYVRFLATVNFDHTTEELSPRFLDRSWVITLDAQNLDLEERRQSSATVSLDDVRPLSYAALLKAFGSRKNALMDVELKAKLGEVLEICARNRRPVSPRSQNMMASYVVAASELMECQAAQTRYAPVDYAVAQKVLPLLSGTEEALGSLLDDLGKIAGLPLTRARVEHMLEAGADSGYFQYFA